MKYIFFFVRVQIDGFTFDTPFVREIPQNESIEKYTNTFISDYYSGDVEEVHNGYRFHNGRVHVMVENAMEINEEQYKTLNTFL